MKFALGIKKEMTQVFDGVRAIPATVLEVAPMTATRVKTAETDGYAAVQVGIGARSAKTAKSSKSAFRHLREFRVPGGEELSTALGDTLAVNNMFAPGDAVSVAAISKGKGFQGVVKRHGFAGGPRTHGQKHSEREPGSIGSGGIQRVFKGMRMAGRMGGARVTVQNLRVLQVVPEKNLLLVSGAVPGRRGTVVEIRGKTVNAAKKS